MWGRRSKRRIAELEQENKLLREQQAKMERLLVEVRADRHEFVRRLQAVEHWLQSPENAGNGPGGGREDLRRYLDESAADLQRMNEVLRGERGHTASLLEHLAEQAAAAGIRLKLDLETPLAALPIPMIDQTKLAGNLLENALEAAKRYNTALVGRDSGSESFLEAFSAQASGLYILEVRNSSPPIPGDVLDRLFARPVASSKEGGDPAWQHGIGAYVVAQTVRKHGGRLDFTFQQPVFSVKIKLPILL